MEPNLGGGDKSSKDESDMTSGEKLDAAKMHKRVGMDFSSKGSIPRQ